MLLDFDWSDFRCSLYLNIPGSLGALPVPKATTGATDYDAPSVTALSGEVKAKEHFAGATGLK